MEHQANILGGVLAVLEERERRTREQIIAHGESPKTGFGNANIMFLSLPESSQPPQNRLFAKANLQPDLYAPRKLCHPVGNPVF
jgi:hypothetical protein